MGQLDFEVVGQKLKTIDPTTGDTIDVKNKKSLIRKDTSQILDVVGVGYKIVQNNEVFEEVERKIYTSLGEGSLSNAQITDSMAFNGQTCYRQYVFPEIRVKSKKNSKSDIAFRVVVINGFGNSAIKVYSGAIDFFCMNGMISGEYGLSSVRHSVNVQIERVSNPIAMSLKAFKIQNNNWLEWQEVNVNHREVVSFLESSISSKKLRDSVEMQIQREYQSRGTTKWAVYSALTYYATHDKGDFAVNKRSAGNEASILFKREKFVNSLTKSEPWRALSA